MIIIKLLGGLGNQMFQYAVAKVISEKHDVKLKMDLRGLYSGEDVRTKYELDIFGIPEVQATKKEYFPFFRKSLFGSKKLWRIIKKYRKIKIVRGPNFEYNPEIIQKSTPNMYLAGLFQSEKYFVHKRDMILKLYTFQRKLSGINLEVYERMRKQNSVAIHIRRGEFAKDEKINKKIGTVPLEYYYKAVELILKRVSNPFFYIFSDSPDWVKKNFKLENAIYVDWNKGKDSYIDMQLMSLCKHNIIANSTFSWWGAWLNRNPHKIVIAPKQWFYGELAEKYNTKDLIPENWLKL